MIPHKRSGLTTNRSNHHKNEDLNNSMRGFNTGRSGIKISRLQSKRDTIDSDEDKEYPVTESIH